MNETTRLEELWPDVVQASMHELRQDLSAVLHQVELLSGGELDDAMSRRSLAAVERNAEGVMHFIDDLAEFAKIVEGKTVPKCRLIDVDELMMPSADDRAQLLAWTSAVVGATDSRTAYTDPVIVERIVAGVLQHGHRNDGDDHEIMTGFARVANEGFIDVVFSLDATLAQADTSFRAVTLVDGISLFVAHLWAQLVGGQFGVPSSPAERAYRLRLPTPDAPG